MTLKDTFDRMVAAMEHAGYPVVLDRGKTEQATFWPRAVIAYFLYADRWNDRRIATLMHRSRPTVSCCRYRVQDALDLPDMYDDVIEIIDKFKASYYELFGHNL